jgi:hypothetical protein
MPTAIVTLTPINVLINSALSGDKEFDLFALGLAYNTLASPAEASPPKPGATPIARWRWC